MRRSLLTVLGSLGILLAASDPSDAAPTIEPVQLLTPAVRDSATAAGMSTLPILSGDGRFLLFFSTAANLVSPTDARGVRQAYLRDLRDGSVRRVSVNADGVGGDEEALDGFVSDEGRWVAFASAATNLLPGDENVSADIFLRDMQTGEIRWVTKSVSGGSADAESSVLAMTGDGRYVAFSSDATDLVVGDTNGVKDVFVFDRTTSTVRRVSEPSLREGSAGVSDALALSEDGQTVVFGSDATNLAPGIEDGAVVHRSNLFYQRPVPGPTRMLDVFPRGLTVALQATILAFDLSADGRFLVTLVQFSSTQGATNGYYRVDLDTGKIDAIPGRVFLDTPNVSLFGVGPRISGDGRLLAYEAFADVRDPETDLRPVVYGWDADTGVVTRLSSAGWVEIPGPDGSAATVSEGPWGELMGMSRDGRYIVFLGGTTNDAPGTARSQVMMSDRTTGEMRRLSRNGGSAPREAQTLLGVSLSIDGQQVAFESMSADWVEADYNEDWDVFWYDWEDDRLRAASLHGEGLPSATGFGASLLGPFALSADGNRVVFSSLSSQLVAEDRNRRSDVFVRDIAAGTNLAASLALGGGSTGNGSSRFPVMSSDGRWVTFVSDAPDLVAGDTNHLDDVFVRDLTSGVTTLVSRQQNGAQAPGPSSTFLASADAAWIVFGTTAADLDGQVAERFLLFDRAQNLVRPVGTNVFARTGPNPRQARAGLSPDGQWLVYYGPGSTRAGIHGWNRDTGEVRWLLPPDASPGTSAAAQDTICRFSSNGRYAVILARASVGSRLYLYDFQDAVSTQAVAVAAMGVVSDDGRRLAYLSASTATSPVAQVRLLDRSTGVDRLISAGPDGMPGNNSSIDPWISPDGRFVVFSSRASNLVLGDHNEFSDVFVYDLEAETVVRVGGNGPTTGPIQSLGGRTVVVESSASDFTNNDFNGNKDLFLVRLPGAESGFRVTSISRGSGGEVRLVWPAKTNGVYRVQASDQLPARWTDLPIAVQVTDGQGTAVDQSSAERPQRYYRVQEMP
ncbi:MAG: PD40 domain-containing protein [Verrucomicrobiales bacterium]|nr:PD40 domain-containing protein [Verrucomicrobiales bacterium]